MTISDSCVTFARATSLSLSSRWLGWIFICLGVFASTLRAQSASLQSRAEASRWTTSFLENAGQWRRELLYFAVVDGVEWQVERDRIVLMRHRDASGAGIDADEFRLLSPMHSRPLVQAYTLALSFDGGNPDFAIEGESSGGLATFHRGAQEGVVAFEPRRFGRLRFREVYPGIDAFLFADGQKMRLEWDLRDSADLHSIRVSLGGVDRIERRGDDLLAWSGAECLLLDAIRAYSGSETVQCRYAVYSSHCFGFEVGACSAGSPLYVDPGVTWSSYLSGSGSDGIYALESIDGRRVTIAGSTTSPNFPTTPGAWSSSHLRWVDVFVATLDLSLSGSRTLLASTYLGGTEYDSVQEAVVRNDGTLAVVGYTDSIDFPTTVGCFQPRHAGGSSVHFRTDLFIAVLDLGLIGAAQLRYGTYLGGRGNEYLGGACLAAAGRIAICGDTSSMDFPTTGNALFPQPLGAGDGFIAIIDSLAQGAAQVYYSSYIGGIGGDTCRAISAGNSTRLLVAGETGSLSISTTPGAFAPNANSGSGDVFVLEMDISTSSGAQVSYCTYLGGPTSDEVPLSIKHGPNGQIYIGGHTYVGSVGASDFPTTPSSLTRARVGGIAGFFSVLDPSRIGSAQLRYSTLLDGVGHELCLDLDVDRTGIVDLFLGTSSRTLYATAGAFQESNPSSSTEEAAFVLRLDPSRVGMAGVLYGSFFGGSYNAFLSAGQRMPKWACILGGSTQSSDLPTTPTAWSQTYRGGGDGFLSVLDMLPTGVTAYGRSTPGCQGPSALTVRSMPRIGNPSFEIWSVATPPSAVGVLLLGDRSLIPPVDLFGTELFVDPSRRAFLALTQLSEARGVSIASFAIPAQSWLIGQTLYAQSLWFEATSPSPCPPLGLSASHALEIVLQR